MIKSPLRYPGGKSRALKQILPLVPDFQEFREPFLGGGSVFVALKQQFPERQFWVNDLYLELATFWQELQAHSQEVVELVRTWRTKFDDGKTLHRFVLDGMPTFSPIEMAAAFFVLNRITFSGTSASGGFSKQAFEKRFTESSIVRAERLATILADTKITNLDFQNVIEAPGEEVFIFLDPPYLSATKSALYGKNGNMHKGFEHERFAATMKACKHKWLITYDNSPEVRELFDFAHIFTFELTYGMRNVKEKSEQREKEIFISNYLNG